VKCCLRRFFDINIAQQYPKEYFPKIIFQKFFPYKNLQLLMTKALHCLVINCGNYMDGKGLNIFAIFLLSGMPSRGSQFLDFFGCSISYSLQLMGKTILRLKSKRRFSLFSCLPMRK
jgi:hypothetical protein